MADGSSIIIQAQDTFFKRRGQTTHLKGYQTHSWVNQAIHDGTVLNNLGSVSSALEQAAMNALLARDVTILPGGVTLKNAQTAIAPNAFNGAGDLQAIYEKDPFGSEFEDETRALYERSYAKARTVARSGPINVRGGTARQAFEDTALDVEMSNNRFREIWQAQLALAQLVTAAVQLATNAEVERWRVMLQAQNQQATNENAQIMQALTASERLSQIRDADLRYISAAAEIMGQGQMTIAEDLEGYGQQGSAQTMFGTSFWR